MAQTEGVQLREITFDEALEAARVENKLVLVECYSDGCAPCKMMIDKVFPLKACGDYFNPRYVSITMNTGRAEAKWFRDRYYIGAVPTFLMIAPDGEELGRYVGADTDPASFIAKIEAAIQTSVRVKESKAAYEAGKSMATGWPYLQALTAKYEGSGLPADVRDLIRELYWNSSGFEKFRREFFTIVMGNISYGDPIVDDICINKPIVDQVIGSEMIDR